MVSLGEGNSIRGTVDQITGMDPARLAEADVSLVQNGTVIHSTKVNSNGEFVLSGVAPGSYAMLPIRKVLLQPSRYRFWHKPKESTCQTKSEFHVLVLLVTGSRKLSVLKCCHPPFARFGGECRSRAWIRWAMLVNLPSHTSFEVMTMGTLSARPNLGWQCRRQGLLGHYCFCNARWQRSSANLLRMLR